MGNTPSYKDDQIAFLWKLLDDISTAGDIHKPEINAYFKCVENSCSERTLVANSFDGQTLTIKESGLAESVSRSEDLANTLENGLGILCESIGVNTEKYDTDQADTECYLDCFKDAAAALKKFGIKFDDELGEFVQIERNDLRDLQRDAERYRFIRFEDNWGPDPGNEWGELGELTLGQFDDFVDYKIILTGFDGA